jgi:hypothetical protein
VAEYLTRLSVADTREAAASKKTVKGSKGLMGSNL